jgi:hypothetical protein
MDEMRLIRSFLDEAPPSAEVVAEGRHRLNAGRAPKAKRTRLWGGLVVVVAAATAIVIAIATDTQTPRPKPQPAAMSARQVLLTAAGKAAATPVGRYWHTHVISSEGYHIAHGDYMIFGARHEIDQWIASRDDKDSDVFRSRFAAAVPQTPKDRAAWKRAGSPSHWIVRSNGSNIPQSGTSEKWDLTRSTPADKRNMKRMLEWVHKDCLKRRKKCPQPPGPPTPEQREALARDPRALRQYLLTSAYGAPSAILRAAGELLLAPSSPALRAAVFRVLADEPGVRWLGTARDPLNRPAMVLATRAAQDGNVFDNELLLDPVTYVPLGTQTVLVKGNGGKHAPPPRGQPPSGLETKGMKPGAITHSEIYVAMGWTNTAYGG